MAAQGAQSEIFPLFSPPFWAHFRYILELKTDEKNDMILDAFFDWIWVVFWLIFSIILERFWIDFDIFREFAKTRKIAPRSSESTKIKGLGSRTWHQNQKKTHRNMLQNLKREIIPKWSQNGSNIEAKWSPKGIKNSMFFWFGFGMALETLMGLRRGCDWAATGLRRVREWGTFSSGSPRAALVRAGLSNKSRQRGMAWRI